MVKKETSPRLGRGLAALLGDQAPQLAKATRGAAQAHQPAHLPVEIMAPSPFQPRQHMDPERLAELADSIRSRGVLQPILVRPDPNNPEQYQIIAGERRWRAAQLAGLHTVPVHVRLLDDTDAMAAALVENLQRADLNPIEEAEGLQRLVTDYTLTQEELAGAVGKSRPHIANTLRLLNLPSDVRTHVRHGTLSAGHARALLTHPDPATAARAVLQKGLNVRQTEALVASATGKSRKSQTSDRKVEPEITQLEQELSSRLGLKVKISFDGAGGAIRIDYRSLEQFEEVLRLLKG